MILAIDFDEVIHDSQHPIEGRRMGPPLDGALEALEALSDAGYGIIIHTCKAATPNGQRAVEDWLEYYGIPYDQVTATKPIAAYYIDDRAIRHTDWTSTLTAIGFDPEGD